MECFNQPIFSIPFPSILERPQVQRPLYSSFIISISTWFTASFYKTFYSTISELEFPLSLKMMESTIAVRGDDE
jgi:hypothetical protein